MLLNCVYRKMNLLAPMRGHFQRAAKYPIFAGKIFRKSRPPRADYLFKSTKEMLGSIEI